nr:HK97-gp10 family putative phage morphogenesis protein [Nocardioides lijunqiniae]
MRTGADDIEPKAELVVAKGGHDVVADAQVLAPYEFGVLTASIGVDVDGLSFVAGPTVEYGLYQELGTSEMPPQPYMAPAFDRNLVRIESALGQLGAQVLR